VRVPWIRAEGTYRETLLQTLHPLTDWLVVATTFRPIIVWAAVCHLIRESLASQIVRPHPRPVGGGARGVERLVVLFTGGIRVGRHVRRSMSVWHRRQVVGDLQRYHVL
jgi:hypothetical protein